jgi:ribonuclease HI
MDIDRPVFTDGSCIDGRTRCAVFLQNEVAKYRLLDDASIFTAELYAIHQALQRFQKSTLHDFVIYSDSLCSLESIEQLYRTRHPLLKDVINNLAVDKNIAFVWVPGHSNMQGNEKDAKAATKMNTCDLKSKIKKESLATWQNQWEETNSHMLNIKRTTKRWESIKVFNRRAQVVITFYHRIP